ncbi:MAG TPA: NAD(P)-dependent oxidoreductase [Chloroflexota bacterium]
MSQPKVFVFAPIDPTGATHRRMEQSGCELILGDESWLSPTGSGEDDLIAIARDCEAITGTMLRSTSISRRVLESCDKLRIVAKYTIGCDDVDTDAATELGIMVTHGPTESNWGGVAEGVMARMLCLLKKLRESDRHLKSGGEWRDPSLVGTYLGARTEGARADGYPGVTVGIVGLGRVGSRLADLLRPWKVRILACDPYIPDSHFADHGAQKVDLPALLAESDVVTLHVFLSKETTRLIGEWEFAHMKPSAIFVNAARGPVVDEQALITALQERQIAAAALDVFETEPLPLDSPLRQMDDRVLLSPHMISNNHGSGLEPAIGWATDSILMALRGEVPDNVFNKDVIPAWCERFAGRPVI